MNAGAMILYVDSLFLSPYAMSVFVTLTEKAIPFQMRKVDLTKRENIHPEYVQMSLTSRVPAISFGGLHLSESSAISEYLEELYPSPEHSNAYPLELEKKAKARQIQAWLRSDLLGLRDERSTEVVFWRQTGNPLTEAALTDARKLTTAAELLVGGKRNIFDSWCIADTDLALMLRRLIYDGDCLPSSLIEYVEYQWERPSVQAWLEYNKGAK